LQRVQLAIHGETFNGRDLRLVSLDGQHATRSGCPTIEHNRAGTTYAMFTAKVNAGVTTVLSQKVGKRPSGFTVRIYLPAVDAYRYRNLPRRHNASPFALASALTSARRVRTAAMSLR
jgi:hypothetical protein